MESTERRFAHLLQPIRELIKNWEVDVASELNDYLDELDEMSITFDDGKTSLNFAQAALLIQGSACIYSKKVELLHSLVYQTLEYINNNKNKKKNNQAAESQEKNSEDEERNWTEDHAEFTDLEIDPSNHSHNDDSFTTVDDIPLPPECLIPHDTRAKQKLPLCSLKSEILCRQKDFRLAILNPRMEVILLALASSESRELIEDHPQTVADLSLEPLQNDEVLIGTSAQAANVSVDGAEDLLPLDEHSMDQGAQEHIERHQAPSDGRVLRQRRQVEAIPPRAEDLPPVVNAWTLHDPYAVLEDDKPFKSGKCYKVPEGLDDGGKRKRRHPSSLHDFESWFRGNFNPSPRKLKNGPHFTDLNYIYLTTVKDRIRAAKRIYRKAGVMISDQELEQTLLQPEDTEEQKHGEDLADKLGPQGNLDIFEGEDNDNFDIEHDCFPENIPAEFGHDPHVLSPDQNDELSYEQLVKLRVEQLVVNSQGFTQETALSRRVKDWEDQIKPILALQEERPAFDIHDYGDRIVGALGNVGQRRLFSSIVSGLDNFEASKYLLASLQLANDYTVKINSEVGLQESVDSMGLTLLSVDRATDRFKNLQARD